MYRCNRLLLGLVLCAACGSVEKNGHLPDAAGTDDAGTDAAVPGTVHVTVLDPSGSGAPAVGATVVFINPDGMLVKKAATDTLGKADADVLPGANVTSVILNNAQYQLQTVLAIKPGDDIILGSKNTDTALAGTFTVTFPALTNATHYQVSGPCGSPSVTPPAGTVPSVSLTIYNYCKQATMDLVVLAYDANNTVLSSIEKTAVPFVANGSTTITGSYPGLRSFTGSYTNVNPIVDSLSMSRAVPDGYGISTGGSMSPPTPSTVFTTSGVLGAAAQVTTSTSTANGSVQIVRQGVVGTAATYGLDLAATLLPWIGEPSYDAANTKLVIPMDTTGTSMDKPDMFRITAGYSRTDANQVTTSYSWAVFGPEIADITLPALPADLSAIIPTATDTVRFTSFPGIALESDSIAGYDAIRNDLNSAYTLYSSTRAPAGTVRLSRGIGLKR